MVTAPAKPVAPKAADAKKVATAKAEKNLGTKPVVLVPPADGTVAQPSIAPIGQAEVGSGNSLYNGPAVGTGAQPAAPVAMAQPTTPVATAPKRKTLGDLVKSSSTPAATTTQVATAPAAPAVAATNPGTGGYVAQLTTFKTKAEASDEYARLVKKHGAIISKYAPIIETAEVAGSTRFRLNIGPMATMEIATNICSSLFAAGERDCVVHRQ